MSLAVELSALRGRIVEYGPTAFLVTVTDRETPHVVSVTVRWENDRLVVPVGRRTRANLEHRATVTLLWPPGPDPGYSMIVDGTFVASPGDASEIAVEPQSAVLHRVVGVDDHAPKCLPLGEPNTGA